MARVPAGLAVEPLRKDRDRDYRESARPDGYEIVRRAATSMKRVGPRSTAQLSRSVWATGAALLLCATMIIWLWTSNGAWVFCFAFAFTIWMISWILIERYDRKPFDVSLPSVARSEARIRLGPTKIEIEEQGSWTTLASTAAIKEVSKAGLDELFRIEAELDDDRVVLLDQLTEEECEHVESLVREHLDRAKRA